MSNALKKFIHRKRDKRDLEVFAQIICSILKTISEAQSQLQSSHYEDFQYDDLMIMINHRFHEYLKVYINHRYATPSQILSAEGILVSLENIHNDINRCKAATQNLVKRVNNETGIYDVHSLPPEVYAQIRDSYLDAMHAYSTAILSMSQKIFLLITYDMCRLESGVNIIDEYYRSSGPPKIKVSYNASMTKEDILKNLKEVSDDSDNINNKSPRKEERK